MMQRKAYLLEPADLPEQRLIYSLEVESRQ